MALRIWDPAPVEVLRLKVFDLYQLANPRQPVAEPVVIVDIDEESLAAVGQWPWPRIEVARMVDRLRLAGAAAIAFDVVFPEPERTSPGVYRSEEHTSELQSLMRIPYAVYCLHKNRT